MYQNQQSPNFQLQGKKDETVLEIFKWIFFVFALIFALIAVKYSIIASITFVLIALILCPSLKNFLADKLPFLKRRLWKGIILSSLSILGLAFLGSALPTDFDSINSSNSSAAIVNKTKKAYAEYRENALAITEGLSERDKKIRADAMEKLLNNRVYNDLVLNKTIDQKYLILIQAIGEGIARSTTEDTFGIALDSEDKCKSIPEGYSFVIDVVRLALYGGISDDLLDVIDTYRSQFGEYGYAGTSKYDYNGVLKYKLEKDFSIAEILVVIDGKEPQVLDAYYESVQKGLIRWTDEEPSKSRFPYLSNLYLFNDYLKENYPSSKYVLNFDLKTTAAALYSDYDENEVNADDIYKRKNLLVTGTISDIGVDAFNDGYITLATGEFGKIRCELREKSQAKNFRKGIKVTLIGSCGGKILLDVVMRDCTII